MSFRDKIRTEIGRIIADLEDVQTALEKRHDAPNADKAERLVGELYELDEALGQEGDLEDVDDD